jgi:hypothetical protein
LSEPIALGESLAGYGSIPPLQMREPAALTSNPNFVSSTFDRIDHIVAGYRGRQMNVSIQERV